MSTYQNRGWSLAELLEDFEMDDPPRMQTRAVRERVRHLHSMHEAEPENLFLESAYNQALYELFGILEERNIDTHAIEDINDDRQIGLA